MRYAVLFQGQGKYKTDFVRFLYKNSEKVLEIFKLGDNLLDFKISDLLKDIEDAGELDTEYAQLLIFMMEYAAYKYYEDKLPVKPSVIAGHSLGEITALTVAEGIKFEDAVKLVYQRGRIMKSCRGDKQEGMMAIQNIPYDIIKESLHKVTQSTDLCAVCANYNSESQIILSGHTKALSKVKEELGENNCKILKVQGAFHSPLMEKASIQLRNYIETMTFYPVQIPVLSGVTGQLYPSSWSMGHILAQQLTRPVLWNKVMDYMENKGVATFAQVTDSQLFMSMDKSMYANHIWMSLDEYCNNQKYDYSQLYHSIKDSFCNEVPMLSDVLTYFTAYPWVDHYPKECIEVSQKSYDQIRKEYVKLADTNTEVEVEQLLASFNALKLVLKYKDTGMENGDSIIKEILKKYGCDGLNVFCKYECTQM